MFNLSKKDDVRKYVIRRTFVKEDKKPRSKAPKIQRLVTLIRLQRRRKKPYRLKKQHGETTSGYVCICGRVSKRKEEKWRQQVTSFLHLDLSCLLSFVSLQLRVLESMCVLFSGLACALLQLFCFAWLSCYVLLCVFSFSALLCYSRFRSLSASSIGISLCFVPFCSSLLLRCFTLCFLLCSLLVSLHLSVVGFTALFFVSPNCDRAA